MKKILATLFISILVLAGCGASSADTGNDKAQSATNLDEAIANLDGKTITIATSNEAADNPFSDEAKENNSGQDSDERKAYMQNAMDTYGFTLEFVPLDPAAQIEDVTASVLAGDPIADVVRLNAGNYEALVATGMLEDITYISTMVEESGKLDKPWSYQIGKILDGTYAVGRDKDARPEMLAFDTDLLEKAGMDETPFDLWMRDEWTWENAKQYFTDVQAGLGEDVQVWGDYPTYIRQYGIASGGVVAVEQDGTINYDNPDTYEAVDYYKGLYDDGLLTFYFDADGNRDYQQAEEAWLSGNTVFFSLQRWKTQGFAADGKNFGLVPYPIKDGLNKEDVYWPAPAGDVYVVPKGVEDVESATMIAFFMSAYGSYGDGNVTTVEEDLTERSVRDFSVEGNEEALIYMYKNSLYEPIGAFMSDSDDAFSPTNAVQEYIVDGTSLTSAFENGQKELEANVENVREKQKEDVEQLEEDAQE